MTIEFATNLPRTAIAFAGYKAANLGRTPELLAHPRYGPVVAEYLERASRTGTSVLGKKIDLISQVKNEVETSLERFEESIALIVAAELAQLDVLQRFFGVDYRRAAYSFGYSLGEISALTAGGVFEMEEVLPPLLSLAGDVTEMSRCTTTAIVYSREHELSVDTLQRECVRINGQGHGVVGMAAQLAPNAALIVGQFDTIDRVKPQLIKAFSGGVRVRRIPYALPPLHTSIVWERSIPDRTAFKLHAIAGGEREPTPKVLSLVSGDFSYNDYNSREMIARWLDQPQRLWDAVYRTLSLGIETILHVGPCPEMIPSAFRRLGDRVEMQLNRHLGGLSLRAVRGLARQPWLSRFLSTHKPLLRAPLVAHVVLEDWLLDEALPEAETAMQEIGVTAAGHDLDAQLSESMVGGQ